MKCCDIPVMILAGGLGTRFGSSTEKVPKPMLTVGGRPMIWHIMKYYAAFGFRRFILCLGYKAEIFKDYFINFRFRQADCTVHTKTGDVKAFGGACEDWEVTLVDTGQKCMTGGRIARAACYVDTDQFMLTYGDGLSDVNLSALLEHHNKSGCLATVTGVRPVSRFGVMEVHHNRVTKFKEKVPRGTQLVNGGFFVMEKGALPYLSTNSSCVFEQQPLWQLAQDKQLGVFEHNGFWHCVDTVKDLSELQKMWDVSPPWNIWGETFESRDGGVSQTQVSRAQVSQEQI